MLGEKYEYFHEFSNAIKTQNKKTTREIIEKIAKEWIDFFQKHSHFKDEQNIIESIFSQSFFDYPEWLDLISLIKESKENPQKAYEASILLELIACYIDEEKLQNAPFYEFLGKLEAKLNELRNIKPGDYDIYDLSFLLEGPQKPRQTILGKSKSEEKKHPYVSSYFLRPMRSKRWMSDALTLYFSTENKKDYKIRIKSSHNENFLKRDCDMFQLPTGSYFYALSPKGGLYALNPHQPGELEKNNPENLVFHHCTFRAGQPVISAGFIRVLNGKIVFLDGGSGHYVPEDKNVIFAAMLLKYKNMIDPFCQIRLRGKSKQSLKKLLSDPEYSMIVKEIIESNPEFHSVLSSCVDADASDLKAMSSVNLWDQFCTNMNLLKQESMLGFITRGTFDKIVNFIKLNYEDNLTPKEQAERLQNLNSILYNVNLNSLKNENLKNLIVEFKSAYQKLPVEMLLSRKKI